MRYSIIKDKLRRSPRKWFVTGVGGFIASHIVEHLLHLNQVVVGLDNFSNGKKQNLDQVRDSVTPEQWKRFILEEGDVRDLSLCCKLSSGADYILHQAALGSVPHSVRDPLAFNDNNVTGTVNMLVAAKNSNVRRFVYASSSSVYGDSPTLPKMEPDIGAPLSPYAVTKYVDELYSQVFGQCYGLETVGLRYFNVFGPRQDPNGAYAAVIPKWVADMIHHREIYINGNGETSRDFCYVENVVQANILAATVENREAIGQAYNIALNVKTTLNELFELLRTKLEPDYPHLKGYSPTYRDFRLGDIMHSHADISSAKKYLEYEPTHRIEDGLDSSLGWYKKYTT